MSFTIRTSCPNNNKYYIRKANGGYNGAIQGKPTRSGANVLSNCVGYANGRFAEIIGKGTIQYQLVCNAENFIEKAKSYGLKVSSVPTLGGIMVWKKGSSLGSKDGAGHVAIVERINSDGSIYTSESAYKGAAFYNSTRTNSNGRWGIGSAYSFRGCIINPAVGDVHYNKVSGNPYKVGITYTVQTILKVRNGAGTNFKQKTYSELTPNAKQHAYSSGVNKGCLKKGTRVTCLEVRMVGDSTWIKIPSGWIAAKYGANTYVL